MEAFTEGGIGCGETDPVEKAMEEATGITGEEDNANNALEECSFTIPEVNQD